MSSIVDYRRYYDLERYLFEEVSRSFKRTGLLNAHDFFCIVIWKANRAKSKIARRMLSLGHKNLERAVAQLARDIVTAENDKERMRILSEKWGFRLPMASAILTVLFPQTFTVYDVRVCEVLGGHGSAGNRTKFDNLWSDYQAYVSAVRRAAPAPLGLRDKDRWLWGKSFVAQLREDLRTGFKRPSRKVTGSNE
jgi:hypothetical protein